MKMASLTIRVAFPLFKYAAEVTHFTPRAPTAIERMVLRLIHDYQNEPLSSLSLLNVFEQQLGVANALELVSPSIEELKVLGVLERPQKDISAMSIAEFRLSNDGKDFYRRNQLPGSSKIDSVEYLFDPLTHVWSDLKKASFKQVTSDIELDEESFQPGNPSEEIRRCIEQGNYRWKTSLTKIRNIDTELDEVQQNPQLLELKVSRDGNLFLEANDDKPTLQQWLKQVKPEYIREAILNTILSDTTENINWPRLNSDSLNAAVTTCPVSSSNINQAIKNCFPEKHFFTIGLQNHPAFTEIDTPHLILAHELPEPIIWNNEGKNIVRATKPQGLENDLLALIFSTFGESPVAVSLGVADLYWTGQPAKGLIAIQQDSISTEDRWGKIKKHLENCINTCYDPKVSALTLLWKNPEIVISEWLNRYSDDSFEKLLHFGAEFEQAMQQIVGTKIDLRQQWQEAFSAKLSEKIILVESFEYQNLCDNIKAVNDKLPNFKAKLHRELIEKALPIKKQNEFLEVRRLVDAKLEFPESFIVPSLIVDWVNCILSGKNIDLAGPHAWIEDLERCKKCHQELIRNVGQKALDIAGEYEEIAVGSISIKALESAKQWLQFSETMQNRSEYVYQQTNLKQLTEQVKNWKTVMERYMFEPLSKDQQWVVFDTSTLMDFPDILDKLDKLKNIKLALPLKVLDELDNHKHDNRDEYQDRAITAQKIIKKIESLSGSITKIKHIPELLPHEHTKDPSSDDMIISAARSLALSPVFLVSSDFNFRNKAKALELQVMATQDFIQKFFSISQADMGINPNKQSYPQKRRKK